MTTETATTLGGAFFFGLASSLHCVGMCGPIAGVACQHGGCFRWEGALHYHLARLASYALCGALAGGVGWLVGPRLHFLFNSKWFGLAILAVAAFLVFGPSRLFSGPRQFLRRIAPGWVGLATPLIPCGPLYLMLGLCGLAGSAARGASLALVFGLGTLPLLWMALHQWDRLRIVAGARVANVLQRALLAAAALVLLWRILPPGMIPGPACCQPPAS